MFTFKDHWWSSAAMNKIKHCSTQRHRVNAETAKGRRGSRSNWGRGRRPVSLRRLGSRANPDYPLGSCGSSYSVLEQEESLKSNTASEILSKSSLKRSSPQSSPLSLLLTLEKGWWGWGWGGGSSRVKRTAAFLIRVEQHKVTSSSEQRVDYTHKTPQRAE